MLTFHAFCSEWPAVQFFNVLQYISDIVAPFCMNSTIGTPFLPPKQLPSAFWQADNAYLNFLSLVGEHVYIPCFVGSLVSTLLHETHVSSCYSYHVIEKFITIFVVIL
jgi:hypothetical protein